MSTEAKLLQDLYFDCPLCGHKVDWHFRHSNKSPKPVPCRYYELLQRTGDGVPRIRHDRKQDRCGCEAAMPEKSCIEIFGKW